VGKGVNEGSDQRSRFTMGWARIRQGLEEKELDDRRWFYVFILGCLTSVLVLYGEV